MWWAFFHPGLMEKQSLSCLPYATSLPFSAEDSCDLPSSLSTINSPVQVEKLFLSMVNTLQTCYGFALKWVEVRCARRISVGDWVLHEHNAASWMGTPGVSVMTYSTPGLRTLPLSGNAGYRLTWGLRCFLYIERPANWTSIIHII